MSETKRERYIRILSGLGGADISSEACKELVELLKEQPETAAQTAESAQNVSNEDLISRKAAIDAIYHHLPSVSRTRARTMLHEVPSAQPEIIRCKDCKYITEHYDTDGNVPYWTCSEWDSRTDYDGFCHYAERRTDDSISD